MVLTYTCNEIRKRKEISVMKQKRNNTRVRLCWLKNDTDKLMPFTDGSFQV